MTDVAGWRLPPSPGFTWYYDRPVPYWPASAGHLDELIRDVPRSCTGRWDWTPAGHRFTLAGHAGPCPWHSNTGG